MRFTPTRRSLALAAAAGIPSSLAVAQQAAELDLHALTLYRSGVAYFELRGTVDGDAEAELRFEETQINDVLKSLVLIDLDGGTVGAVGYDSAAPLAKRLAGFAVDLSDRPTHRDILERLRGERVRIHHNGVDAVGRLLALDAPDRASPDAGGSEQPTVALLTSNRIETIALDEIEHVEILNNRVGSELESALRALADDIGPDTRAVDLRFSGEGERNVVVGYVHETPIWKTSYRLVLPEGNDDAAVQGWAIVENTTNADWEDVRLTLVSGRPVSFVMDLAEPLFLDRPEMPVPVQIAALPRAFEEEIRDLGRRMVLDSESAGTGQSPFQFRGPTGRSEPAGLGDIVTIAESAALTATTPAVARGEDAGETFRYTLNTPITIERQRSAMLPILSADVGQRRLSVYIAGADRTHPMRGVELSNTSGLELMPGPISVFDESGYAGDSIIDRIGDGDERILTYATDLDVSIDDRPRSTERLERLSIVNGTVVREIENRNTRTFTISNADEDAPRTVSINVPKLGGNWSLVEPSEPDGETPTMLRFETSVGPGASAQLVVERRLPRTTRVELSNLDTPALIQLSQAREASQQLRAAIDRLRRLTTAVNDAERLVSRLMAELAGIEREQSRIRQNMQAISEREPLYERYIETLTEQEDRISALRTEFASARDAAEAATRERDTFLTTLDVR